MSIEYVREINSETGKAVPATLFDAENKHACNQFDWRAPGDWGSHIDTWVPPTDVERWSNSISSNGKLSSTSWDEAKEACL